LIYLNRQSCIHADRIKTIQAELNPDLPDTVLDPKADQPILTKKIGEGSVSARIACKCLGLSTDQKYIIVCAVMQFGKVYQGQWRGTLVAVKCITIPSSGNRNLQAEKMAVSALTHVHCHTLIYALPVTRPSNFITNVKMW